MAVSKRFNIGLFYPCLDKTMYHGKGVSKAIANVNDKLAPLFVGKDLDIADQKAMDQMMLDLDGTPAKSNLGPVFILLSESDNADPC